MQISEIFDDLIFFNPANCPPSNLTASLDCASNVALISWSATPTVSSFTATMMDESSGLLSCSSFTTSCKVPNLKCGQLYSVTATYFDGICSSMPSDPIYMQSGRNNHSKHPPKRDFYQLLSFLVAGANVQRCERRIYHSCTEGQFRVTCIFLA